MESNHRKKYKLKESECIPMNLALSCPFGIYSPVQCQNCKFSILINDEQTINEFKKSGDYEKVNSSYSCVFAMLLYKTSELVNIMKGAQDGDIVSKKKRKHS